MPAAAVGKAPKVKALRPGQVVTNTLGTGGASKPWGYSSFIEFYRAATRARDPPCFAAGCRGRGTSGGHVKLAPSPLLAAFKLSWYIVPACPAHNKRSSCGSYQVRGGTAAARHSSLDGWAPQAPAQAGLPLSGAQSEQQWIRAHMRTRQLDPELCMAVFLNRRLMLGRPPCIGLSFRGSKQGRSPECPKKRPPAGLPGARFPPSCRTLSCAGQGWNPGCARGDILGGPRVQPPR
jgi:hypothetical protein